MSKILTLDTSGYVSDPPMVTDIVMNNFFVANYSQTNVHWGQIHSLPYLLAKYAQDMNGLSNNIESALQTMLGAHFDTVNVSCEIVPITQDNPLQNIRVTATVYKDGAGFDVGKLLTLVKNRISKIENI